jgi:hypothetical protein
LILYTRNGGETISYWKDITVIFSGKILYNKTGHSRLVVVAMVFNATFNNISVISSWSVLLVVENRVPRENHRPAASHWQALSHKVHFAMSEIQTHNRLVMRYIYTDIKYIHFRKLCPKNLLTLLAKSINKTEHLYKVYIVLFMHFADSKALTSLQDGCCC